MLITVHCRGYWFSLSPTPSPMPYAVPEISIRCLSGKGFGILMARGS